MLIVRVIGRHVPAYVNKQTKGNGGRGPLNQEKEQLALPQKIVSRGRVYVRKILIVMVIGQIVNRIVKDYGRKRSLNREKVKLALKNQYVFLVMVNVL
tara:strand:+ start:227 stop:520 length:294 start_codon:yes stop_codon:yes gene_type:complete